MSTVQTEPRISPLLIAASVTAMILLPAADRLAIVVQADVARTMRFMDVALLVLGAALGARLWARDGLRDVWRSWWPLWLTAGGVLLLVVVNSLTCVECGRQSFASPATLLRGLALMVASHLLFVTYSPVQRNRGVLLVAVVAAAWSLVTTLLLVDPRWVPALLYSETPYFHKPFSSPVQAAHFCGMFLLLASGAAVALNRPRWLYAIVPAFTLAIAQSGSRSGMVLVLLTWTTFATAAIGGTWLTERRAAVRLAGQMAASMAIAIAAIGVLRTTEMTRSLAFVITIEPSQFATGGADAYRARLWKGVLDRWRGPTNGTPVTERAAAGMGAAPQKPPAAHPAVSSRGVPAVRSAPVLVASRTADVAPPPGASEAPAPPAASEAPHNVYLEFLQYGGWTSMFALLGLMLLLVGLALRHAWDTRDSPGFAFATALVLSVLFAAAINYGNVTLHLSFVWVFFGLVTACVSAPLSRAARSS